MADGKPQTHPTGLRATCSRHASACRSPFTHPALSFTAASTASGVAAILTPTTPSAAFAVGEKGRADPTEMYLNDIFTVTVNMAGLPGISVPSGLDAHGLPLGLQVIGRPFAEETLFALGAVIEKAAGRFIPERWW